MGFGDWVLGFKVLSKGLWFMVYGLRCMFRGPGFMVPLQPRRAGRLRAGRGALICVGTRGVKLQGLLAQNNHPLLGPHSRTIPRVIWWS